MKVKAVHRNARIAPRKVRLVARLVCGRSVQEARDQLAHMPGKAAKVIHRTLNSAVANATHNYDMRVDALRVGDVIVSQGIVMKRHQPVSRGTAHPILKRTSHVTVWIDGERLAKKAKKEEIATVSAGEYVARAWKESKKRNRERTKKELSGKEGKSDRPVATTKDKEDYTVSQKIKMQQQGGDRKKTYRRKSI